MSESRGNERRTSARLGDKEDLPVANGIGHTQEPEKNIQGKAATGKTAKVTLNGASTKTGAKRKPGEQPSSCRRASHGRAAGSLTTLLHLRQSRGLVRADISYSL